MPIGQFPWTNLDQAGGGRFSVYQFVGCKATFSLSLNKVDEKQKLSQSLVGHTGTG